MHVYRGQVHPHAGVSVQQSALFVWEQTGHMLNQRLNGAGVRDLRRKRCSDHGQRLHLFMSKAQSKRSGGELVAPIRPAVTNMKAGIAQAPDVAPQGKDGLAPVRAIIDHVTDGGHKLVGRSGTLLKHGQCHQHAAGHPPGITRSAVYWAEGR
ncbi:MAG: hypothetical protein ACKVVP_07915 [Chloroflexota bacterium]